jgi:hypothetical protein
MIFAFMVERAWPDNVGVMLGKAGAGFQRKLAARRARQGRIKLRFSG